MVNPPQNRNLCDLNPLMQKNVTRFLDGCKAHRFDVRIGETRRTHQRQSFLFAQNSPKRWLTNCDGVRVLSMHQYGIATDFLLYNKDAKTLNWDGRAWRTLYAIVPPFDYGLEMIPQELVHLQLKGSQAHVMGSGKLDSAYIHTLSLTLT